MMDINIDFKHKSKTVCSVEKFYPSPVKFTQPLVVMVVTFCMSATLVYICCLNFPTHDDFKL